MTIDTFDSFSNFMLISNFTRKWLILLMISWFQVDGQMGVGSSTCRSVHFFPIRVAVLMLMKINVDRILLERARTRCDYIGSVPLFLKVCVKY